MDGIDFKRAGFTSLGNASTIELEEIFVHYRALRHGIADQALMLLKLLSGPYLGFPVDRLEHSLQSATRALRAGAEEEVVVAALLHDVGDNIAPDNHGAFAAEIIRPWVSETTTFMVRHHNDFVGAHYFGKIGKDPNGREKWRGHPAFALTARFCDEWDAAAFDPAYDTLPLEVFEPMVRRIFSGEPWSKGQTRTSQST